MGQEGRGVYGVLRDSQDIAGRDGEQGRGLEQGGRAVERTANQDMIAVEGEGNIAVVQSTRDPEVAVLNGGGDSEVEHEPQAVDSPSREDISAGGDNYRRG